ncbi:unnamed protein product [Mytilus coruscus]|uniref:Uncharacterized protein n=1 Tax=Mytilus coruscus TaxID=42192 RepID=A0A6J8ENT3_MYTCO|nr:unnamed protein product [Mytilus coruscus]
MLNGDLEMNISSAEDEIQYREPVVPDYLDITDSVNPHSVEMSNYSLDTTHIPNSTYSGSLSSDYESIDSRSGNTDTSHEQDVVIVDSTDSSPNNSIERGINSDIHQYVNTNIMNPYEQLKNQTRDIHTYKDLNDGLHFRVSYDREHGSVDNEYEEIDSVSYYSVNWRTSVVENTNRLNPESERVSDIPISGSSGSSITLFHFYVNTSIYSTNIMPARHENELNHPSQLGTSVIGTNNSHSNNSSESGTLEFNQYMNIATFL